MGRKTVTPECLKDISLIDLADHEILDEVPKMYKDLPVKDQVVLDLGAHIGVASRLFAGNGAKQVIAIEPDPRNYIRLAENAVGWAIKPIHAAVVPLGVETVTLSIANKSHSNRADRLVRGRATVEVRGVSLEGLLEEYQPSVVKCDIEWQEYQLPKLLDLPSFVTTLAMEIHSDLVFGRPSPKILESVKRAWDYEEKIRNQGFNRIFLCEKKMYNTCIGICANYTR